MSTVRRLGAIHQLSQDHDALLVDLWGVVHDGERLFDGVRDALEALAHRGVRVVFLSNSSRLGAQLTESLVAMGIPRDVFADVVSSGDVTREVLRLREGAAFARAGERPRVLHVGSAAYVPWLFELDFDFVEPTEPDTAAELIVATGSVANDEELAAIRTRLSPLAARSVPLVCTNPDRVLVTKRGLGLAPGAVAHVYASVGGDTFLYGKPHAPIYREALARLDALGVARARVAAVGDMIETDILGARGAGITSVLVTSGVHAAELGLSPSDQALSALFAKHGAKPDAIIESFGALGA